MCGQSVDHPSSLAVVGLGIALVEAARPPPQPLSYDAWASHVRDGLHLQPSAASQTLLGKQTPQRQLRPQRPRQGHANSGEVSSMAYPILKPHLTSTVGGHMKRYGQPHHHSSQRPRQEKHEAPSRIISAQDAIARLRRRNSRQRRNKWSRRRPKLQPESRTSSRDLAASHSSGSQNEEEPNVVFFPTGQEGDPGVTCQDGAVQGGGFNTFAFLGFLLSVFNAVRCVSYATSFTRKFGS